MQARMTKGAKLARALALRDAALKVLGRVGSWEAVGVNRKTSDAGDVKVLERLATSDKTTIVIERQLTARCFQPQKLGGRLTLGRHNEDSLSNYHYCGCACGCQYPDNHE
jgi:hypothetical protein